MTVNLERIVIDINPEYVPLCQNCNQPIHVSDPVVIIVSVYNTQALMHTLCALDYPSPIEERE